MFIYRTRLTLLYYYDIQQRARLLLIPSYRGPNKKKIMLSFIVAIMSCNYVSIFIKCIYQDEPSIYLGNT